MVLRYGHDPGRAPSLRLIRGKYTPAPELPEPEIIKSLRTGAGVRRDGLGQSLTAMGLERVKLGSAQRLGPELAEHCVVPCVER